MNENLSLSPETLAAQALGEVDHATGALSPAIHPSTIYEQNPDRTYTSGLAYTRADNPTYEHAERLLAALEGGAACMVFASASRQMTGGFGGMLALRFAGGEADAVAAFGALRVFKRATSLGGVESLVEHRRSTEGPSSPVPHDLLRISVGLEAPEDLIGDLAATLEKVSMAGAARGPVLEAFAGIVDGP